MEPNWTLIVGGLFVLVVGIVGGLILWEGFGPKDGEL